MGEGRAKVVVGTVEREIQLAGGMKWVGDEVVREVVKARPGREGRIGAPGTQDIEGKFSMGKEVVPKVIREVGVGGGEGSDEVVFAVLTDFSAGLDLCIFGGTNEAR